MKRNILICGGGNGAHVLAGLMASKPHIESRVLTMYQNEAELWNQALEKHPLTRVFTSPSGKVMEIHSRPHVISNNPAEVVPGADFIFITIPAFSHEVYLRAIEPYIQSPTIVIGFPGQPGFDFQSHSILKDKLHLLTLMSAETFPWACRIVEYGSRVRILGLKKFVKVATIYDHPSSKSNPLEGLRSVIGSEPVFIPAAHFLELSLMFATFHPGLMYGKWKDWDGIPLSKKPLFYQGADDVQANCIEALSNEILNTAREITKRKPGVDLSGCMPAFDWLVTSYGSAIEDPSCLKTALVSNKAYDGLTHPMREVDGGLVPDFTNRYLSEDIPFGLVVTKGLAQLAGVDTPVADKVIKWAQEKLGKEYLIGSELKGEHLTETRAPQVYGITSLDDLDSFMGRVA